MGRPLFCATVAETTRERALAVLAGADLRADLVEIRLDVLDDPSPEPFCEAGSREIVFTCRGEEDGGGFRGRDEERLDILRRAVDAGAAWIDVELRSAAALADLAGRTRVIVSHHDFEGTPADLDALLAELMSHRPAVAKIVTTAHSAQDSLRVLALLRDHPAEPVAAHALGTTGLATRVLGARLGSALVYGAARLGAAGAPGQPTLGSLLGDYGFERDLENLSPVLLFGGDLAHSVSPAMMNAAFAGEGIPALYVPWPISDAADIPTVLRETGAAGAAVTIPHKEALLDHFDAVDPLAARIGAVNTVSVKDGRLTGWNTDLDGAVGALRAHMDGLTGQRALVVGAGGAARAAVAGLKAAGCRVSVANRTTKRAKEVAKAFGAKFARLGKLNAEGLDVIVNATPAGQWPNEDECPVPASLFRPGQAVLDMVYNPRRTLLLATAAQHGGVSIPGIEMLARQAARQVEIWFGSAPDAEALLEAGVLFVDRISWPILLIGPRGAGKTTMGRILAELMEREFVDLDAEIEEGAGKPVAAIFSEDGEVAFRTRERFALSEGLDRNHVVLSAGAGIVEDERARQAITSLAPWVVLVTAGAGILADRVRGSDRPSLTGRPLEEEVEILAARRDPLYRELARIVVDTSEIDPETAADEVVRALCM